LLFLKAELLYAGLILIILVAVYNSQELFSFLLKSFYLASLIITWFLCFFGEIYQIVEVFSLYNLFFLLKQFKNLFVEKREVFLEALTVSYTAFLFWVLLSYILLGGFESGNSSIFSLSDTFCIGENNKLDSKVILEYQGKRIPLPFLITDLKMLRDPTVASGAFGLINVLRDDRGLIKDFFTNPPTQLPKAIQSSIPKIYSGGLIGLTCVGVVYTGKFIFPLIVEAIDVAADSTKSSLEVYSASTPAVSLEKLQILEVPFVLSKTPGFGKVEFNSSLLKEAVKVKEVAKTVRSVI